MVNHATARSPRNAPDLAIRHGHGGIVSDEIGPLPWKPGELPSIIVKEDAALAPRLTAFD